MIRSIAFLCLLISIANGGIFREDCDKINVGLVLDSSSGIGDANFDWMLSFSKRLINNLNVGLKETKIAAMHFNTHSHTLWNFKESTNRSVLIKKLSEVQFTGGRQHLARAITYARQTLFRTLKGLKKDHPSVVIIFTNGLADNEATRRIRHLKKQMTRVIIVPVGTSLQYDQLRLLASSPSEENILPMVGNVVAVLKEEADVSCPTECPAPMVYDECGSSCYRSCEHRISRYPCIDCVPGCMCPSPMYWHNDRCVREEECPQVKIDLIFLISATSSFGESNLEAVKQWMKLFARNLDFSNDRTRIGIVQYSTYHPERPMRDQPYFMTTLLLQPHQSFAMFNASVDAIRIQGSTSFTARAISSAVTTFRTSDRFSDRSVKKILLVIPSTYTVDRHMLASSAEMARMHLITTYAIGIGNAILSDLKVIATGTNSRERVYLLNDVTELFSVVTTITTSVLSSTGSTTSGHSLMSLISRCPNPLVYNLCATCHPTCFNKNRTECTKECRMECTCPLNTVLHQNECVDVSQCPPTPECPETMVYSDCAGCDRTCDQRNKFVKCPPGCKAACTCPMNTFLYNSRCVSADECPSLPQTLSNGTAPQYHAGTCPDTMIFSTCATCTPTCSDVGKYLTCTSECRKECTCPPNTYLNGDRCISEEECNTTELIAATSESQVCPHTMVFSFCASRIRPCLDESFPHIGDCKRECTCPFNTTWDNENGCIPPHQCPSVEEEKEAEEKSCLANMIYRECGPCILTCDQYRQNLACKTFCNKGCTCPINTYLHEGRCVSECPEQPDFGNYIDLSEAVKRIEDVSTNITDQISWFDAYSYNQDDIYPYTIDQIRDRSNGMYNEWGNKVKMFEDTNVEEIENFEYDRSNLRFPRFSVSNRAIHPFFLLASINNPTLEKHEYTIEVTSRYGAGAEAEQDSGKGMVRWMNALIEYQTFQVYNTTRPTICQVFFTIANNDWRSRAELYNSSLEKSDVNGWNKTAYKVSGRLNNVLLGYMLFSKHAGSLIEYKEIKHAMMVLLKGVMETNTVPNLPEIRKDDLLPEFWHRASLIAEDLNAIFNNSWYNYAFDDTEEPIDEITTGGNGMFDIGNKVVLKRERTGDRYEKWLKYNQKNTSSQYYDIAVGGADHPFMTMLWITNQNSYKDLSLILKIHSYLGTNDTETLTREQRNHRLLGDFDEPNVAYHYYQLFGGEEPSVCKLFFTVQYKDWNSEGIHHFSFKVTSSLDSNFVKAKSKLSGQPRNLLLGYVLLSKKNGERITVEEIEQFLRRLSDLLIKKCPESMEYAECAGCVTSCDKRYEDFACPFTCVEGCACPPNTFLYNDKCVPEEQCPAICPSSMIETECARCVPTCYDIVSSTPCTAECKRGCTCPENTYLHEGKCVKADECPIVG